MTAKKVASKPEAKDEAPAIKNIHQALAAVNREVDAIGKLRQNKQQGFAYRGIDDAYNALHDLLAKHGVITLPRIIERDFSERQTKNGGVLFVTKLMVEYTFIAEDGSSLIVGPVLGEGMDSADKGANKALAVAHKYALFQTFTIPTLFTDSEADNHDVAPPPPALTIEQRTELGELWEHLPEVTQQWIVEDRKWDLSRQQAEVIIKKGQQAKAAAEDQTNEDGEAE